ncbi:hypothetical protein BRADI_4g22862v3 [Brachypodium distachyon]|uniref:F-box domain-containing protein n=1 Tax=Brachypodium distachyon TaxID=15368 RepID=A0A0Q3HL96_BRADI|nr:hypothetical protein BRADI_4g22862v3 [Brachypodium distachyon]
MAVSARTTCSTEWPRGSIHHHGSFGADHLFDRMAKRLNEDGERKVAVDADEEDRISALPEDVLQQLLSWLPSCHAVQTCVLARDWRNRWKTVPRLCIYHPAEDMETYGSFEGLNNFVNNLLHSREQTPLDECVINTFEDVMVAQYVELWIRYAVSCKVKMLKVFDNCGARHLRLSDGALVS